MSSAKYKDINYIYTLDLAEQIRDDYQNLGISGIQTLIIVFLCMTFDISLSLTELEN